MPLKRRSCASVRRSSADSNGFCTNLCPERKIPAMNNVPADLKYTKSHEWVRTLPDGSVEIGITDHAQHALGDLVFVEVPEAGRVVAAGEACAVVESVKAASDVYAPVGGEVLAGNPQLAAQPESVNTEPYTGG